MNDVTCSGCTATIPPRLYRGGKQRKWCTEACRLRAYYRDKAAALPPSSKVYFPACQMCGGTFSAQSGVTRMCSTECRDERARQWTQENLARKYDYCPPRGAKVRETIKRSVVAERDNWTCGICAFPIDPDLAHPDPLSFTVDHIVPRSRGGDHTYANVRAAHWFCNVVRGDREAEMPRARKRCGKDGCDNIMPCPDHRGADRRPSSYKRGYDVAYQKARAEALEGATICGTCGCEFTENNPATGGHVVAIRDGGSTAHGIKAQCRRCNYGWKRTGT